MVPPIPPPPQVQPPAIVLIHDARAVHDIASVRFRDFTARAEPDWTVGKTDPGSHSGAANIPGSFINIDTGQFVVPENVNAVVTKEGSWATVATATATSRPTLTSYSWSEPLTEDRRAPAPEDYYSPFVYGGTILFRYDPSTTGIAQFDSVRLIFPDWAKDVAPASAFVQGHHGLLENGGQQAPDLAQLHQLLADKNRLLVIEAFRELAEGGHLGANIAFERLIHADAPLDAILSYLMLASRGDELAEQVNASISVSRDEKKLQSIALGAFSALLFRSQDPKILARSKNALQRVRSRVQELKIPLEKDSYLYLILSKTGML